jgi:hypothetical protein
MIKQRLERMSFVIKPGYVPAIRDYLDKMGVIAEIDGGVYDSDSPRKFVPLKCIATESPIRPKETHARISISGLKKEELDNIEAGIYIALLDKAELDKSRVPPDLTDR